MIQFILLCTLHLSTLMVGNFATFQREKSRIIVSIIYIPAIMSPRSIWKEYCLAQTATGKRFSQNSPLPSCQKCHFIEINFGSFPLLLALFLFTFQIFNLNFLLLEYSIYNYFAGKLQNFYLTEVFRDQFCLKKSRTQRVILS